MLDDDMSLKINLMGSFTGSQQFNKAIREACFFIEHIYVSHQTFKGTNYSCFGQGGCKALNIQFINLLNLVSNVFKITARQVDGELH